MSQVLSEKVRSQFNKTALCKFHARRKCRKGDMCTFAHDPSELCTAPDLTKTSLCQAWKEGRCPLESSACCFAHGLDELQMTTAFWGEMEARDTKPKRKESIYQLVDNTILTQAGSVKTTAFWEEAEARDTNSKRKESIYQLFDNTILTQAGSVKTTTFWEEAEAYDTKPKTKESIHQFSYNTMLPQAGCIESSAKPDLVSLFSRWPHEFISIADMGHALMQFVNSPCIDKDPDVLMKIEKTLLRAAPAGYED